MLESVRIQNFQPHEDLTINFDEKITTIIGPSDAGKSAACRVLRWICANFSYDHLIREGSETATGMLVIDGHTVIRKRGKTDNLYFLDGEEFRAFGVTVPEPIARIVQVGDQNFQGQHDSVYWLQDTAGEVSRRLNAVVDLGVIDKALGEIGGKVRVAAAAAIAARERLTKSKQMKSDLAWVLDADKEYQIVEELQGRKESLFRKIRRVRELVTTINSVTKTQQDAREEGKAIREVGMIGQRAMGAAERTKRLGKLVSGVRDNKTLIQGGIPDVSSLSDCVSRYHEVHRRRMDLTKRVESIKAAAEKYRTARIEQIEADGELEDAMVGACPVCGQESDHKH